ncbi:MAG TPA: hypothetical protein VHV80_03630 [Steroidobacteraceae bacterium]|jgi:outer membrane receptor for ferrienterochelin and colicin|nr:hypothetical protein [Steroidobacteraceae bacterium]
MWNATRQLELRAGVNNVLDKDPPIIPSLDISGNAGAGNSFAA